VETRFDAFFACARTFILSIAKGGCDDQPMTSAPDTSPVFLQPWTVKASRDVIRDRWIRLRADDCVTAEGTEVSPYYVLGYPDWVQVVALDEEDHVILVEQYRHAFGGMALELPAGAIDREDPSPLAAGGRELAEETGYVADEWRYVGKLSPNPATHTNFCHTVLAQNVRAGGRLLNDPAEQIRVVRVPRREAIQLAMSGRLLNAMHVASLAVALSAVGKWDA